jgi:glycosyltransferase involved in cell wall biosynthesis
MHVLHCLSHSNPGGAQRVVFTLVTTLRQQSPDLRQSVILPAGGEYVGLFHDAGISVTTHPTDVVSPSAILRMKKIISRENPDVIHSHGKGGGLYSRLSRSTSPQVCRIHTYHGFHPPGGGFSSGLYIRYERTAASAWSAAVCVSASEERDVLAAIPSLTGRTCVIPNVIDAARVREESKRDLSPPCASLTGDNGSFVVSMIAREDPVKNHPLAFAAAQLLLARDGRVRFVFAGVRDSHEGVKALQSKYPGRVLASDAIGEIPALLRHSDVVLLTSRKEGGPLVVLEAFALGVPVVGTDVPGIADYVRNGLDGILCPESPEALATAIGTLLTEPGLRERLASGATERGNRLDVARWAGEYQALYNSVTNARL